MCVFFEHDRRSVERFEVEAMQNVVDSCKRHDDVMPRSFCKVNKENEVDLTYQERPLLILCASAGWATVETVAS